MVSPKDRFEDKYEDVTESGCWIWIAYSLPNGYGRFGLNGKTELAHRASYMLHKGDIPEGFHVCHTCDTPSCVNPDHLFLGTPKDNMQDCKKKGRMNNGNPKGESNGKSKLTENDVFEIRDLLENSPYSQAKIAEIYEVYYTAISKIKYKRTWRSDENTS